MYTRMAELYDLIYSFKDYASESRTLHDIIDRCARTLRRDRRSLLDVACGTGVHLSHLREWYDVEGIELSPWMLDVARRRLPDVPLHQYDMRHFDLRCRFDAVTCLFSAIAYMRNVDELRKAIVTMARHVLPGGLVIVEPWIMPDRFIDGHTHAHVAEGEGVKVARMIVARRRGDTSVLEMHHMVATASGVERFFEQHEVTLFTHEQYLSAFTAAGLVAVHDAGGLNGRGLYVGLASTRVGASLAVPRHTSRARAVPA
ncbi:MAG: class I SAM-dependent methyltransferase [Gemmatimonadota bacterium]|nr:class I SAM-dependent methyltransferase [Gemmatimonadota bacterium]